MSAQDFGPAPSFRESLTVWLRIGLLSFGGPAAQIALMHRELVDKRNWLSERDFMNALSFCMLLPGPEAMQLATYSGLRLHGTRGGLAAGLLFVVPGALVITVLATIYVFYGQVMLVEAMFLGVKAAVVVIVIEALLRVSKKILHSQPHKWIAAAAFVAIFFFSVPFPVIILCAALVGAFLLRSPLANDHAGSAGDQAGSNGDQSSQQTADNHQEPEQASARSRIPNAIADTTRTCIIWLAVWLLPLGLLLLFTEGGLLRDAALFFSKLAVVTFGGAYAVLAYMAQDVVTQFGWLSAGEMVDALGLAETTPGPLILVTQFVGFVAGFHQHGFVYALGLSMVVLWVTFAPCFLWIFAGAPYIERLSELPRLQTALAAITAAVVGVILNLSIWFALHVFFSTVDLTHLGIIDLWVPELASLDWRVLLLTALSAWLLLFRHWSVMLVLAVAALGGIVLSALQ